MSFSVAVAIQKQRRFSVDNLMFGVQLADVLTRCSSHHQLTPRDLLKEILSHIHSPKKFYYSFVFSQQYCCLETHLTSNRCALVTYIHLNVCFKTNCCIPIIIMYHVVIVFVSIILGAHQISKLLLLCIHCCYIVESF